jgi:membrane protein
VYYSAQIFLLGAEFTWIYARTFGSMRDVATPVRTMDALTPPIPFRNNAGVTT